MSFHNTIAQQCWPSVLRMVVGVLALSGFSQASEPTYITNFSNSANRSYVYSSEDLSEKFKKLDKYAVSSKLPALKKGDPDEVRFWVTWANFDPETIGYDTTGYVVSAKNLSVCRISYARNERMPFIGHCRLRKGTAAAKSVLPALQDLATLAGRQFNCGILDGEWIEIDGMFAGQRFAIGADNPESCKDDGSQLVARILEKLR